MGTVMSKKIISKLTVVITPKRMSLILTATYILGLIPLMLISVYNYPSADDYTNANETHYVWMHTKSILAVFAEAFRRMCEEWLTWRGSFLASFLSALSPNLWGERMYMITPWIAIGALSIGTGYLLHTIFEKVLKADKYVSRSAIMLILFMTVQCMVGGAEAFYWYSGAINYIFTHGISLLFYGLLITLALKEGKKKKYRLIVACVLGFLLGGGNQMTMLNIAIVMLVIIILRGYRNNQHLIAPIVCFFIGLMLNVSAPGNYVRATGANGMNPVKSILVSFYYCLDYCLNEWTDWPVIILLIAMAPLFWKITAKTDFEFRYPLVVVLFGYCMVSAMMTPPLFAVGNVEAGRLKAITFAMYILVLVLGEGYVIGWIQKKQRPTEERPDLFSLNEIYCLLGCLIFFTLASVLTVVPNPHFFTASSAITDLIDGSAQEYGEEQKLRIALYNSGKKDVVVKPLTVQPHLLFFSDIKSDEQAWENKGICRYYEIDSIKSTKE